jgi:hypothetical protein
MYPDFKLGVDPGYTEVSPNHPTGIFTLDYHSIEKGPRVCGPSLNILLCLTSYQSKQSAMLFRVRLLNLGSVVDTECEDRPRVFAFP